MRRYADTEKPASAARSRIGAMAKILAVPSRVNAIATTAGAIERFMAESFGAANQQAEEAMDIELVVLAHRGQHRAQLAQRFLARFDAEEVDGGGRAPLGKAGGAHRRPAGVQGAVEHVAVAEVLDHEPVRITPVVEQLAALT